MYLTRIAGIETLNSDNYFIFIQMYLTRIAGIETAQPAIQIALITM